jgi:tRNA dimethylallyltransferase
MKAGRRQLIVVIGPTAVGKTAVSIQLAKHFKTEIISADSRQIFREMTVGTAKPDAAELSAVRHHFINSHSIVEDYDAARYGEDALQCIHELLEKVDRVILCGGSGLYVKAVTDGFDDIPEIDPAIRASLIAQYESNGLGWLQDQLRSKDPEMFEAIDQKNPHRLIRALEVKTGTGQSILSFRRNSRHQHDFQIIKVGLELPRDELYARIDQRMDDMIEGGLFEEAKELYPFRLHNALQTVGYQEIFDFMDDLYDRSEAIRLLKRNSRRYAKRQLTWFKKDHGVQWFHPGDLNNIVKWVEDFDNP